MSKAKKQTETAVALKVDNLSTHEIVALDALHAQKAIDAARLTIEEGSVTQIDMTLRIRGTLSRGESYEKRATSKLLSKAVLALLLRRLGATGEAATDLLAAVLKEAAEADKSAQEVLEADPTVKLAFERVERALAGTKVRVPGSIKGVLAVERL